MSQALEIFFFIKEHGTITTMQAFELGITRLASRVHDLKKAGVPIEKRMITVPNRHGKLCRVAEYYLETDVELFSA